MAIFIKALAGKRITGSEVSAIVLRAKERAVLDKRDDNVTSEDIVNAIESFIDSLDPNLLQLQEFAAVLACSDKRYLPKEYLDMKREDIHEIYNYNKSVLEK